jgi:hypothetical protein
LKGGKLVHAAIIHIAHEVMDRVRKVLRRFCAGIRNGGRTAISGISLRGGIANLVAFGSAGLGGSTYAAAFKGMI